MENTVLKLYIKKRPRIFRGLLIFSDSFLHHYGNYHKNILMHYIDYYPATPNLLLQ